MVHVAAVILVFGARHQVDHRGAGAQLHEADLGEAALDMETQHLLVEGDRAVDVGDAQDDVVKAHDKRRRLTRRGGTRGESCIIGHGEAPSLICGPYCDGTARRCARSVRAARRSAALRTPSWSVSIRSNRASAARRARSTACSIYWSRVMSPPRVGAAPGATAAALCASTAAGHSKATRPTTRTARMIASPAVAAP